MRRSAQDAALAPGQEGWIQRGRRKRTAAQRKARLEKAFVDQKSWTRLRGGGKQSEWSLRESDGRTGTGKVRVEEGAGAAAPCTVTIDAARPSGVCLSWR